MFSDSQAAISRIQHGRCGPAKALARAVVTTVNKLYARGSSLTVRWTPAHAGVEGNEQADGAARHAAEEGGDRVGRSFLQEASFSHLMRKTTEARSQATSTWVRGHVGRRHRYRPPLGGSLRKGLARVRKELAGRFYQLLSGHAGTAELLRRVGQAPSDKRWWCSSGERQSRHHLFIKCRRWLPEIRRLWRRVETGYDWGDPRAPSARLLFHDTRATPALLEFLEDTWAGQMPGHVLLAGVRRWTRTARTRLCCGLRRRRPRAAGIMKRRMRRAYRSRMYFSFVIRLFSFVFPSV